MLQKNFYFLARRFVAGERIDDAIAAVRALNAEGMSATLDFLGEDVESREAAIRTRDTYLEMLDAIASSGVDSNVSVKLSAMGLLFDEALRAGEPQRHRGARGRAIPIRSCASTWRDSAFSSRRCASFVKSSRRTATSGAVLQAYLKRTPGDVDDAIALGARVRLCKGAYNETPEVAYKADAGDSRAVSRACETALAARQLSRHRDARSPADRCPQGVRRRERQIARDRFEFQMLYGVRPQVQRQIADEGYRLRIYVPFGTHWAALFLSPGARAARKRALRALVDLLAVEADARRRATR